MVKGNIRSNLVLGILLCCGIMIELKKRLLSINPYRATGSQRAGQGPPPFPPKDDATRLFVIYVLIVPTVAYMYGFRAFVIGTLNPTP